jgi:hypothetical protein
MQVCAFGFLPSLANIIYHIIFYDGRPLAARLPVRQLGLHLYNLFSFFDLFAGDVSGLSNRWLYI